MTQAVTYERETKSVAFQGKIIVLESLTPVLPPKEKAKYVFMHKELRLSRFNRDSLVCQKIYLLSLEFSHYWLAIPQLVLQAD